MNKINNKNLILTLGILAFVMFLLPSYVFAGYGTNYSFGDSFSASYPTYYNDPSQYQNSGYYTNPVYSGNVVNTNTAPTPAPAPTTVYSNGVNPDAPVAVAKKPATVAKAKAPTEYTLAYVPVSKLNSLGAIRASNETTTNPNGTALTANAINGIDGFLPKSIIGWILFAIFLLIIVILFRKIFGATERYHAAPLKHD